LRLALPLDRDPVHVKDSADNVDAHPFAARKTRLYRFVDLAHLVGDERMAGRIDAGQRPERRKAFQDAVSLTRRFGHHCRSSRALAPTRATAGLQKWKRRDMSPSSTGLSPSSALCTARSSNRAAVCGWWMTKSRRLSNSCVLAK